MAVPDDPRPRTFTRKRAGLRRARVTDTVPDPVPTTTVPALSVLSVFGVLGMVLGTLWMTSPVWGVFTDRLPVSVAWLLPSVQSTWPAGLAVLACSLACSVVDSGAGSLWRHRTRRAAVGAMLCAFVMCAATVLVPGVLGRVAEGAPGPKPPGTVRVLSVNTWYHQASPTVLADLARDGDADVVVLSESSAAQAAVVVRAAELELVQPVSTRTRGGGTALLVRPDWLVGGSVADLHLTRHQNPVVSLDGPVPFTMMGVHTNAPAHSDMVGGWVREMRDLRDWSAGVEGPVVMAGDLNATTAHPELRRLGSVLDDCGGGLFAAPTWPRAGFPSPVPVLRLDHVLVRGFGCAASGVVGVPGSDHAGVWADLRV